MLCPIIELIRSRAYLLLSLEFIHRLITSERSNSILVHKGRGLNNLDLGQNILSSIVHFFLVVVVDFNDGNNLILHLPYVILPLVQ